MNESVLLISLVALAAAIPLAHLMGWLLTRALRVTPGHIREVMPVLPAARPVRGKTERRWDRNVHRAERLMLRRLSKGAVGVEANAMAGQLAMDVSVVEEALSRFREEIPCRLRVTRSGRMLHDFAAHDLATLRRRKWTTAPLRVALFCLAFFANLGAAWPVIGMGAGAALTLAAMGTAPEGEAFEYGLAGLFLLTIFLVVNLVAGLVVHLLLTPARSGPKLADLRKGSALPRRRRRQSENKSSDSFFWDFISFGSATSTSRRSNHSTSSSSGSGGGGDLEDVGVAIIVVVLLVVIAACLAVFLIWIRGLWLSVTRRDEAGDLSPTQWVRSAAPIDWYERYIPTNDLVLRTYRALWRVYTHRRPQDSEMGTRALAAAKTRGGVVSALDLVLQEGMDLNEATEVGSRLCGLTEGELMLSEEGDLAFGFQPSALSGLESDTYDDLGAEYIEFNPKGVFKERGAHPPGAAPVNVVGLTKGHLAATDRLVAGTFLMAFMGLFPLYELADSGAVYTSVQAGLSFLLVLMAMGTTTLSAVTRYTAKACAVQGALRDLRRALVHRLREALGSQRQSVDLSRVTRRLEVGGWKVPSAYAEREVVALAADLDLEPVIADTTQRRVRGPRRDAPHFVYDITRLRQRLEALDASKLESVFESDQREETQNDEVVFDTDIVHDRVSVLA